MEGEFGKGSLNKMPWKSVKEEEAEEIIWSSEYRFMADAWEL